MKNKTIELVGKFIIRNPIGDENIYTRFSDGEMAFKRTTNRYAPKGTISHNKGFMNVSRDGLNGQFTSRIKKVN
tara:strand:- start:832 stop:1053 length:222 start_codon:yes stop_codon:yes gene_type:complete